MYVRFVCADPYPAADAEMGMFLARDRIDFSKLPGSLQRADEEAFCWFRPDGPGGLKRPDFTGKRRSRNIRKALFWFKTDASFFGYEKGSVVRRARELAKVITDAGVEIREIRTDRPGRILWEDSKQVLALPDPDRRFRAFCE